jgi:ferrous iron transport protein A
MEGARYWVIGATMGATEEKRMANGKSNTGRKTAQRTKATVSSKSIDRSDPPGKGESREPMAEILLRHMMPRQKGVISKITAQGELGRRIRDMGLVPGIPVEVQGRAPLKDPVAIRIRDFTLTLRNNEADQIVMRVEG